MKPGVNPPPGCQTTIKAAICFFLFSLRPKIQAARDAAGRCLRKLVVVNGSGLNPLVKFNFKKAFDMAPSRGKKQ